MNWSDWMSQEYIEAGHYLLKLVRAALLQEAAPDRPQEISWKKSFCWPDTIPLLLLLIMVCFVLRNRLNRAC